MAGRQVNAGITPDGDIAGASCEAQRQNTDRSIVVTAATQQQRALADGRVGGALCVA